MRSITRSARVAGVLALTAAGLVSVGAAAGGGGTGGTGANGVPAAYTAVAAADPAPGEVVTDRVVIDNGHVDAIAPKLVDGTFRTLFRDSRTSEVVWREPTSVVMHLTSKGRQTVPDPADGLAFIGNPGDVYYAIPQTQDPEVLWAGWSTEEFQSTDIQGRFGLSLDKVEGPGALLVFGWSPFGEPLTRFDSRDGLPDSYSVSARTHEHANWVFTEAGVYRMTFTFKATLASGEDVSDSQVFTMAVGDVDPDDVTLPGEGGDTGGQTGGGDGGASDGGSTDGGASDGGTADGGQSGGGDGGATDGGTADGGTADGGTADGGASDGGSTDGGQSGGATDGGGTDGGQSGGGDGGATDGGADNGGTDGGVTDGGSTEGGSADGGTDGGSADGGATGGGGKDGGATGGNTPPDGGLAETGAGAALPLGMGGAVLLAAGAATAVHLHRRKRPTASAGDADLAAS